MPRRKDIKCSLVHSESLSHAKCLPTPCKKSTFKTGLHIHSRELRFCGTCTHFVLKNKNNKQELQKDALASFES